MPVDTVMCEGREKEKNFAKFEREREKAICMVRKRQYKDVGTDCRRERERERVT